MHIKTSKEEISSEHHYKDTGEEVKKEDEEFYGLSFSFVFHQEDVS